MFTKKIDASLNDEEKNSITRFLKETDRLIDPAAFHLSAEEKKSLAKMTSKRAGFIQIALGFAKNHPHFAPIQRDIDALTTGMESGKQLQEKGEIKEPRRSDTPLVLLSSKYPK